MDLSLDSIIFPEELPEIPLAIMPASFGEMLVIQGEMFSQFAAHYPKAKVWAPWQH